MGFSSTLYTKLAATTAITDLTGTRIYPNKFKDQTDVPAIRYNKITAVRPSAMGVDAGLTRYTYQFDVLGATYASADAVKDAIITALRRWRSSGTVQDTFILNDSDSGFDSTLQLYLLRVDIEFIVSE